PFPIRQKRPHERHGSSKAEAIAVEMELQPGQKQATSDNRVQRAKPHLSSELFARKRSATWQSHPAGRLDIAHHFFASNPIRGTAHHCQHLERGQGLKSLVVLTKIEARHGYGSRADDQTPR